MKETDIIQKLSFFGLPYARVLSRDINLNDAEELKKRYAYIHWYSFVKKDIPGFDTRIQKTLVFDLLQDVDTIFKNFNDTCKKHIRRGERNPDLNIVALDTDTDGSYMLYKRVKRQEGARPDIKRDFENCLLFNAYYKGQMIVTMSFYDNGEIIRAKHIASVRKEQKEDAKIVAHASRRLNWEVMKWGHDHGRTLFDIGGITDDPSKAGIREFKESFGGRAANLYMYRFTTPIFNIFKKILPLAGRNIN